MLTYIVLGVSYARLQYKLFTPLFYLFIHSLSVNHSDCGPVVPFASPSRRLLIKNDNPLLQVLHPGSYPLSYEQLLAAGSIYSECPSKHQQVPTYPECICRIIELCAYICDRVHFPSLVQYEYLVRNEWVNPNEAAFQVYCKLLQDVHRPVAKFVWRIESTRTYVPSLAFSG